MEYYGRNGRFKNKKVNKKIKKTKQNTHSYYIFIFFNLLITFLYYILVFINDAMLSFQFSGLINNSIDSIKFEFEFEIIILLFIYLFSNDLHLNLFILKILFSFHLIEADQLAVHLIQAHQEVILVTTVLASKNWMHQVYMERNIHFALVHIAKIIITIKRIHCMDEPIFDCRFVKGKSHNLKLLFIDFRRLEWLILTLTLLGKIFLN